MNAKALLLFLMIVVGVSSGAVKRTANVSGCPKNSVHKECTNICPDKSCQNFLMVSACFSLRCGPPACVCKEGHVYLNGEDKSQGCVTRETCNKLNKISSMKTL
ncbi:unnamed protein product [Caenorhabditis brenneri]